MAGYERPVLVGGAVVEIYSGSAINTGDFDIVTGRQEEFERLLQGHGFVRPSGRGKAIRGWIHPDLGLGFEVVAANLFDGRAEKDRVQLIALDSGTISLIALEDIIADRVGQYASGTALEMLVQAKALFLLYADADMVYLERRIREETGGEYGVDTLRNG